jgi:hypothetical protein
LPIRTYEEQTITIIGQPIANVPVGQAHKETRVGRMVFEKALRAGSDYQQLSRLKDRCWQHIKAVVVRDLPVGQV